MKSNDTFGCTTFRKGKYFGRSYDFYCNNVASSILHTDRVEGVRYESIGMSGSSSNGLIKDKALDGTIEKTTVDALFISIVDGINEKGVAISTLVVPKGDKGVTTGTNPSKPSISARSVPRIVLDKTYSAKNAIKLLSELNIIQDWSNPEYELHWMIADANDTYIVETINNKLSYLGPGEIEGIEDLYNGTLEADVVTNFYQTGFNSNGLASESALTPGKLGKKAELRPEDVESWDDCNIAFEIPDGFLNKIEWNDYDGAYYVYSKDSEGNSRSHSGVNTAPDWADLAYLGFNAALLGRYIDGKYYVLDNETWNPVLIDDLTFYTSSDCNPENIIQFNPDIVVCNTFEMPVDNPTITPYGAGLERYKIIMDAIKDAALSSDEEAMRILNLVQYTDAYKSDTAWYSEFVSHSQGVDNRTDVSEGSAYVNGINELKATYQSIFSEGGKEAVRALGLSWHSNHQCVYDLDSKTMLVYPSENGERAWRVDIHGVIEDNAVEIEIPEKSESDEVIPFIYYGFADGMNYFIVHKNYVYDNQYFYLGNDNYVKHSPSCAVCSFATNGICDYRESAPEGYWDFVASHPDYVGTCIAPVDCPKTMIILEKLRDGGVYDGDEEFNENDWRKVEREEVTEGVEGVPSKPFMSIRYDDNKYINVYRICTPPKTEVDSEGGYYPLSDENGILRIVSGIGDEVGVYGGIYVATLASIEDKLSDGNENPVEVGTKLYYIKNGQPSLEHPVLFY